MSVLSRGCVLCDRQICAYSMGVLNCIITLRGNGRRGKRVMSSCSDIFKLRRGWHINVLKRARQGPVTAGCQLSPPWLFQDELTWDSASSAQIASSCMQFHPVVVTPDTHRLLSPKSLLPRSTVFVNAHGRRMLRFLMDTESAWE